MVSGGGKDFTQSIHLKLFGFQVGRTKRKLRGMHPFSLSLYISYICISHISVYLIYLYISVSIILVKEGCAHAREKLGVIERPL